VWCMQVYKSVFSTTVRPIVFTLGRFTAEDPRKCSAECDVFLDERFSRKLQAIGPFPNGHGAGTELVGVLPRTQGSAMSTVKLFG